MKVKEVKKLCFMNETYACILYEKGKDKKVMDFSPSYFLLQQAICYPLQIASAAPAAFVPALACT